MSLEGGCYCGKLRYKADGDPVFKGECFCRECQYIAGGGPNFFIGVPEAGLSYSKGTPKSFRRNDIENAVTRDFCGECGTHIGTSTPSTPGVYVLKVGTLDDLSQFGSPQMAIYLCDRQSYHPIAEGIPTFDKLPG